MLKYKEIMSSVNLNVEHEPFHILQCEAYVYKLHLSKNIIKMRIIQDISLKECLQKNFLQIQRAASDFFFLKNILDSFALLWAS